ncbi:MAG: hypothetical protein ACI9XK_004786 [Granulosicoccus sp.]|jgi:hypothetical protein
MRTLLVLMGLLIHAEASARKCTFVEPEDSLAQLEVFYKQAEIVAAVEDLGEVASGIQEVKVKRIWKGELGQRT